MPAVTDLVNSSVYNAIRSSINNVLGVGDGALNGYGRTLESVSKADNDVIFAADMQTLFNDLKPEPKTSCIKFVLTTPFHLKA